MHTEFKPEDPDVLREMGYDRRDLKIPLVKKYTIWITASCIACFIASIPVYNYFTTPGSPFDSMKGSTREAHQPSRNKIQPPNPLLQDNFTTKVDIKELRKHEDDTLGSYGWIDQTQGVVRIPIGKAMKMVADKGVSTGQQVPAQSKGNTISQNAVGPGTSGADTQ
jgi:hypothetical protein